MLKKLIIITTIALIIIAGLCFLLFAGGSTGFTELFDKLINDELFKKERIYPVNVNVYEVKLGLTPETSFDRAFAGNEDLEDALKRYFTETGNALGGLGSEEGRDNIEDLKKLYERYSVSRNVDMLILERQIETRKQAAVDLRFDECDIGLQLISISFGAEDFVELRVMECFAAVFNGIPDKLSTYTGVEHFFVFDKVKGEWLIKRHESNSALSVYITDELQKLLEAGGYSLKTSDASTINDYAAQLKTVLDRDTQFYSSENSEISDSSENFENEENSENLENAENENMKEYGKAQRVKAVEYALEYTKRERVRRNKDFGEYERNGTNFTSQCLIAAGIPANDDWDGDVNGNAGSSARENFSNANKFYEYINSPDSGIKARLCDYKDGDAGDIVQFVNGGGEAVHSALITHIEIGNSQNNREYLVTANSEELRNFPLSALGFDIMRIIKVHGYYEREQEQSEEE